MKSLMLSFAVFGLAGCATIQIPTQQLEQSESSMRAAEEVGANAVPAARLHLQLAKDQTALAKSMAADGDGRALLVLARAEADAELALGLARAAAVRSDALHAAEELKAVQARGTP